jgi:hypothetical protein
MHNLVVAYKKTGVISVGDMMWLKNMDANLAGSSPHQHPDTPAGSFKYF